MCYVFGFFLFFEADLFQMLLADIKSKIIACTELLIALSCTTQIFVSAAGLNVINCLTLITRCTCCDFNY